MYAGSVQSTAIGGILESDLEVYMGVYLECTCKHLESVLGSEWSSRLDVFHQVQFGVFLRAYSGVSLRMSLELTREHTVKQAGSVPLIAIGSILETVLESMIENVYRAYLGAYSHAGWESANEYNCESP